MNRKLLVVTSVAGVKKGLRPKINLAGFWLNGFGFERNKLLSIKCSKNNILIKICDMREMNFTDISKLILKDNSNGILHVREGWSGKDKKYPVITISGFWLEKFGFNIGDVLVIDYEYGIINVQRLEIPSKISN